MASAVGSVAFYAKIQRMNEGKDPIQLDYIERAIELFPTDPHFPQALNALQELNNQQLANCSA